jgi:signal transduction histidine kinase
MIELKKRLIPKLILPALTILFIANFYILKIIDKQQRNVAEEKMEILNMSLKNTVSYPLWEYDIEVLKDLASFFVEREEINKLTIYTDRFESIVVAGGGELVDTYKNFQIPITRFGSTIGYVNVDFSNKLISGKLHQYKKELTYIQLAFIGAFILLMLFYSKNIHTMITKVSDGINELLNNNTDIHLNLGADFSTLEKSFNRLTSWIRENRMINKRNLEEFTNTKEELEAAYNQMISINGVLETTLSDLELSESKYKNIFKYSPFGIVLYNVEGNHIIECNNELLEIFDTDNETDLENLFSKENISMIIKTLYYDNGVKDEEFYLNSVEKTVTISVIPVKDKDKYIQVFFKDITEIKNLQIKLQSYAKDLEREVALQTRDLKEANDKIRNQQQRLVEDAYNKGLVEVTSGIIHNIGNIVNVISLNLDELIHAFESNEKVLPNFISDIMLVELSKLENLDEKLARAVKIMPDLLHVYGEFDQEINSKVEYLHRKVEHLKEIVQLQQNFVGSLGTEDYNEINLIIEEVLEIYDSSLTKRAIFVEKDYGKESSLLCDKAQMIQLFSNFIKNSYEAIEEAERTDGKISIKSYMHGSYLTIEIEDNGIGIRPESDDKIFNFGYTTKKHMGIGTGFGLHSCKEIVEKYGGTLEYQSEFGKYTKFIINLPIARKA